MGKSTKPLYRAIVDANTIWALRDALNALNQEMGSDCHQPDVVEEYNKFCALRNQFENNDRMMLPTFGKDREYDSRSIPDGVQSWDDDHFLIESFSQGGWSVIDRK